MADVYDAKRELRSRLRAARANLRRGEAETRSNAVCARVTESPEFAGAKIIALYRAMTGEVVTDEIFRSARSRGAVTLYPRVAKGSVDLVFSPVSDLGDLKPGVWGILEPAVDAPAARVSDADVVIVPGVAFDMKGRRLGQGGGYYDRLLRKLKRGAVSLGVAFDLQVVDEVPCGPNDAKIDCLATESGFFRFNSSGGEAP